MIEFSKEIESFLVDLGFKKDTKENISYLLFKHEIYKGLSIQDCSMIINYPDIHLKGCKDFDPGCKASIMKAYNYCIETYGRQKELCNIREEICSTLRMDDYIKDVIEDYNLEQKYYK